MTLIDAQNRLKLMLLFAAVFGCACATLSGALAASGYAGQPSPRASAPRAA